MSGTSTKPVSENPTLTAEEIGKRFLKLIEGLESRSDLSVERIREVTGISLTHDPGALGAGYWSNDLGEGWRFALTYYPKSPSILEGVGLSFAHREDNFFDMTPICALDFDYYHNALVAMGFRDVPIYGEIRELRSWRYYKGDITLSILPQNVVSGQAGRLCVKSIGTLN